MSAVTAWDQPPSPRRRHRHLHAVPTGEAVLPVRTVARPTVRLTPRARRLVLGAAAVVVALGVLAAGRALPGSSGANLPTVTVTVRPGETLSQIAHRALPSLSVTDAVTRVELANRMNTDQVQAGQVLRLPR